MLTKRLIVVICLVWSAADGLCDADLSTVARSSRVAVLPFADLAEATDAVPRVMARVRSELTGKAVELADSNVIEDALRKHRIRDTAELDLAESQAVALESSSRYLLMGSIDRCDEGDSSAEVAFSARLLDVSSACIVWANSVAIERDPRTNFLGLGSHRMDGLVKDAVRKLFRDFRTDPPPRMNVVQALKLDGRATPEIPCRRIMLVTFGNESETHFAGNIIANELLSALTKRGFVVIDPGRVREMMLTAKELMQGEISPDLLKKCGAELGADLLLTGTVSRFVSVRGQLYDEPAVSFEARLLDVKRGEPVWAKSYSREGKNSSWIFSWGYVHGLTQLSERMSRRLADDLPVRRGREMATTAITQELNP